ncbi:MAG: IS110 family transposase [Velocimicrobium sp.]
MQTEVELYLRIKPYYEFVEYIASLPGIIKLNATIILAEIGVDMDIFDDAKPLCSWWGLAPANNESAGKEKSVRIAKDGAYLKPMMVVCIYHMASEKQPFRSQPLQIIKFQFLLFPNKKRPLILKCLKISGLFDILIFN